MSKKKRPKKSAFAEKAAKPASIEKKSFDYGKGKSFWLQALALFIIAIVFYIPTKDYGYVLDDTIVIVENSFVKQGLAGIDDIFTTESFTGYFNEQKDLVQGARYRPLSIASFAIEYAMYGLKPGVSHMINIFLYGLCCILLFKVLCQLFPKIDSDKKGWFYVVPFAATLLYALHPLHIEAVANIKGRDEILAFLFAFLSMYLLLRNKAISTSILVCSGVSFFLGLMAKETVITFLAIIPLSLYFFRKKSLIDILKLCIPIAVATLIYLIIRYAVIGYFLDSGKVIDDVMNNPFAEMKGSERYATTFYTMLQYIKLNFFPHPLTHDYYPYQIPIMNWTKPLTVVSLVLHLGILGFGLISLKTKNIYGYIALFYLASLSIVSNLVVNVGTFMNERFMFFASLGFCLFVAYLFFYTLKNKMGKMAHYIGIGIVVAYSVFFIYKLIERVPAWKDPLTLNTASVKTSKNSARSNSFMATALYERYLADEDRNIDLISQADVYAKRAVDILPNYGNGNKMLAGVAAKLHDRDGDQAKLLVTFRKVVNNRPEIPFVKEYLEYLNERSRDYDGLVEFYYQVGYQDLFLKSNNIPWALHYLNYGVQLEPSSRKMNQAIAEVYQRSGQPDKAKTYFDKVAKLPSN